MNLEQELDDSIFSYATSLDPEENKVVSIPKPLDDPFLNALCPIKKAKYGSDIDEINEEDMKQVYHVHDPT